MDRKFKKWVIRLYCRMVYPPKDTKKIERIESTIEFIHGFYKVDYMIK